MKLLMHMGYRVTIVDFDDVARFARKELKAVCSDVSHLTCQTLEGEDDIDDTCDSGNMKNRPPPRKVSGQYKCGGCRRRWWGAAYMVTTQEYDTLSEDYTFPDCRRCQTNDKVELLQCKNNGRGCQPYNPLRQPHSKSNVRDDERVKNANTITERTNTFVDEPFPDCLKCQTNGNVELVQCSQAVDPLHQPRSNRNGRDDVRDTNVNTKMERINNRKVSFVDELEIIAERMRQNWIQTSDRNELVHSMKEALATAPMASKIIVQNNINYAVTCSFHKLKAITNMIEVLYRDWDGYKV